MGLRGPRTSLVSEEWDLALVERCWDVTWLTPTLTPLHHILWDRLIIFFFWEGGEGVMVRGLLCDPRFLTAALWTEVRQSSESKDQGRAGRLMFPSAQSSNEAKLISRLGPQRGGAAKARPPAAAGNCLQSRGP